MGDSGGATVPGHPAVPSEEAERADDEPPSFEQLQKDIDGLFESEPVGVPDPWQASLPAPGAAEVLASFPLTQASPPSALSQALVPHSQTQILAMLPPELPRRTASSLEEGGEQPRRCNLCLANFPNSSHGVKKGASWWRCHECHGTVQRMEGAATTAALKSQLSKLKRNKDAFREEVLRMTAAHKRGERQRDAISVFLESLETKNEVFLDESATVWTYKLLVDRYDELGRTEEDARRKWDKWLADAEIHKFEKDGVVRCVKKDPTTAHNQRGQAWKRRIDHGQQSVANREQQQAAMTRLESLINLDAAADPSFAAVGGRWLRAPGSLPALPDGAAGSACPLSVRPRQLTRNESDTADAASVAGSASDARSRSPRSSRSSAPQILVRKSAEITRLRGLRKPLVALQKLCGRLEQQKNYKALSEAQTRQLNIAGHKEKATALVERLDQMLQDLPRADVQRVEELLTHSEQLAGEINDHLADCDQLGSAAGAEMKAALALQRSEKRSRTKAEKDRFKMAVGPFLAANLPSSIVHVVGGDMLGANDASTLLYNEGDPTDWCSQPIYVNHGPRKDHLKAEVVDPLLKNLRLAIGDITKLALKHEAGSPPVSNCQLVRFTWGCAEEGKRGSPPSWWSFFADALGAPSHIAPNTPHEMCMPWLIALYHGTCASGPWQIPLCGMGGFVLGVMGRSWLCWHSSASLADWSGYGMGAFQDLSGERIVKLISNGSWGTCMIRPGDVVYVPRGVGWSGIGVSQPPDLSKGPTETAILSWWPCVREEGCVASETEARDAVLESLARENIRQAWSNVLAFERIHKAPDVEASPRSGKGPGDSQGSSGK